METIAVAVAVGLFGYGLRWMQHRVIIAKLEDTARSRNVLITSLEAEGAEVRADLARLEGVNVGIQEFSRCLVRLDSGKYLASTVETRLMLAELEAQRQRHTSPAPLLKAARPVVEHATVVCDSLDSARATMADVRDLLGQVAGRLTQGD